MKTGSVVMTMAVVEESPDLELKSAADSVTGDDLPSSISDSLKQSINRYLYSDTWRNPLQQSSVSQTPNPSCIGQDFEENVQEEKKCKRHCSRSKHRCKYRREDSESSRERGKGCGCSCCQFCLLIMKCTGILCYVFCCPPIPEMITRKLAFHPLDRGRTYLVSGNDASGKHMQTNNAKKASKLTSLKFEPRNVIEGCSVSLKGVEISIVKTKRGSCIPLLHVGYPRNQHQNVEQNNLVVLFSQPNSSDLGCYFQPYGINLRNISDLLQADLYAYDYSGYGVSTGTPSEKNVYADIEAAYKYIRDIRGPNVRIALLGYSIGTAPAVYMASKHPPNLCGVILVAPFASGLRLYAKRERTCCMDRFLSYERAPEVNVPVLICHGGMDDVIPINHSEILLDRFPRAVEPFFVEHANHLTIFSGRYLTVFLRIRRFLFHETDQLPSSTV